VPIIPAAPLATGSHGQSAWAPLESAQTGERRAFADLVSLIAFLEERTGDGFRQDDRLPSARQ
jgi:hypothetical protein